MSNEQRVMNNELMRWPTTNWQKSLIFALFADKKFFFEKNQVLSHF